MPKMTTTTLDDLFAEEESILDRRNKERRERERAWDETPAGIAAKENRRLRQIEQEALEADEPDPEEEDEEEDEEDEEDEDEEL